MTATPSVIALAGRRIDAKEAEIERFPVEAVERVTADLDALFAAEMAVALVSSAACGADLIALEAAGQRGVQRRVVLPSEPKAFLRTSVIDRPGEWGATFQKIIGEVRGNGDLIVAIPPVDRNPYNYTNEVIIAEASRLACDLRGRKVAVVVWEGAPREGSDATEDFRHTALARGYEVREVLTLRQPPKRRIRGQ
jgi:hypothetical protein